jgi:hypothetical protein
LERNNVKDSTNTLHSKKEVNIRQVLQRYKSDRFSIEIKIKDKKNIKTEHSRLGQLFLMIRVD